MYLHQLAVTRTQLVDVVNDLGFCLRCINAWVVAVICSLWAESKFIMFSNNHLLWATLQVSSRGQTDLHTHAHILKTALLLPWLKLQYFLNKHFSLSLMVPISTCSWQWQWQSSVCRLWDYSWSLQLPSITPLYTCNAYQIVQKLLSVCMQAPHAVCEETSQH